jgi:YidC/Oxa1 family membrane protein insertase
LLALPIVFVFFIVNFPIGLMLYWVTTNLWTVGQGLVTRRLAPKPQPPPKRTSRTEPKPRDEGGDGAGTAPAKPAPKPGTTAAGGQRVRRRKKRGPQAGRRR